MTAPERLQALRLEQHRLGVVIRERLEHRADALQGGERDHDALRAAFDHGADDVEATAADEDGVGVGQRLQRGRRLTPHHLHVDTAHLEANVEAHGVDVQVVHGRAPEALDGLPDPDAVFVGGGGLDVVRAVVQRRPSRVVVALATLERVAPVLQALDGYATDAVLLEASRLAPLGDGHRLVPTNPVFVVSGALT